MKKIKLGDKVRDRISGLIGIATARTEFLNGCIQYTVSRKLGKNQELNPMGEPAIDEMCLEIVEERVIESKEYEREDEEDDDKSITGGPVRFTKGMRGY
jgi:hypothetical protein